jgi:hypothetical protein
MPVFRFLKLPKNQSFGFKPRYWDPEKEALEERLKEIEQRQKGGPDAMKSRISRGFRSGYGQDKSLRSRLVYRSNIRLLIIIAVLAFLAYYFLMAYLPAIVEALE